MFRDLELSDDHKKLGFNVDDTNVAVVNALRRSIITYVPSVAFDFRPTAPRKLPDCGVLIKRNTSPLHNEMLGDRLSLVPICVNEQQLRTLTDDPHVYTFLLHVRNDSAETRLVTTGDIRVVDNKTGKDVPKQLRDQLFPTDRLTGDHILLTKLNPNSYDTGQTNEVDIEAVASVGTEEAHARWCPVSVCFFTNVVNKAAADEAYALLDKPVPRQQFDVLGALRYFHKNEYGEANAFRFYLESECGLKTPYLVSRGFLELIDRVARIRTAIETRDSSKVAIASTAEIAAAKNDPFVKSQPVPPSETADFEEGGGDSMYNIIVSREDHTCGNLIQALIYEKNFRVDPSPQISYVGYHRPHPLESCIVFRVALLRGSAASGIEAFMTANLAWVEEVLRAYSDAWDKAASSALSK